MVRALPVRQEGLSREEWDLVGRLREIPDGPVRSEVIELMNDIVDFVHDPTCREAQADGVPCLSVAIACEQCQQVVGVLAGLHRRLRKA